MQRSRKVLFIKKSKNSPQESNSEMTQMIELVHKSMKRVVITMSYVQESKGKIQYSM